MKMYIISAYTYRHVIHMRNEYSCGNKSNVLTKKIHLLHLLVGPYRAHSIDWKLIANQ